MTRQEKAARRDIIISAAVGGSTVRELSEFFGLSRVYIRALLREAEVPFEREQAGGGGPRQAEERIVLCAYCGKEFRTFLTKRKHCSSHCYTNDWIRHNRRSKRS